MRVSRQAGDFLATFVVSLMAAVETHPAALFILT